MQGRKATVWCLWFSLALAGGLAAWIGTSWLRPQRLLAQRIAVQLDTAPVEALPALMQQLAAFGEDGLPHLAQAMRHARPEVAAEARAVLSEELDRWRLLKPRDAARRLARLARELATDIDACPPETRRMASDLATRILLWPVDPAHVDQQQLIADCEAVLVSIPRPTTPDRRAIAGVSLVPGFSRTANPEPQTLSPLDEGLHLPGGALPLDPQGVPRLPPEEREQPRVLPVEESPKFAPIIPPGEEPRRFFPDTASANTPARPVQPLTTSASLDHIHRLVSDNAAEREEAEMTLRAGGFTDAHLLIARRFADPRASVRRELVDLLARQKQVDARPWLLRLLADRDAEVRRAAASILVTSADPALQHKLRERAAIEQDPDIRRILQAAGP